MKPYVITIARQYGSGGKTVGKMLADKLGITTQQAFTAITGGTHD